MANDPQIVKIDPRRIRFNPENPNVHEGPKFKELVQSIKEHGFAQLPTVRVMPGGIYETIDGEGRIKASIEAGLNEIDVVSRGIVSDKDARTMMHIANAVRNFDLLSECVGLAQLHRDGMSLQKIALQFQSDNLKSRRIFDLIGIGNFPQDVVEIIQDDINNHDHRDLWNITFLRELLNLRIQKKHHRKTADGLPEYDYREIKIAVTKVIAGEIKDYPALRDYIIARKEYLAKKSFNKRLQDSIQEELEKSQKEAEERHHQEIAGLEKKKKEEIDKKTEELRLELKKFQEKYEKISKEAVKRPDLIEEKEKELLEATQQLTKVRQELQLMHQKQELTIEQITARIKREQEQLFASRLQKAVDEMEHETREHKQNIEEYYMNRDAERQLKAQVSFQSTVARLIQLLSQLRQYENMILDPGMVKGFEWISQPEMIALSAEIISTMEISQKVQDVLRDLAQRKQVLSERSH